MIKLGFKEFQRNIFVNLFIVVQLAAAMILIAAVISSILSRSVYYTPFKDVLSKDGVIITCADSDAFMSEADGKRVLNKIEDIDGVSQVCAGYSVYAYYDPSGKNDDKHKTQSPVALDDGYIEHYDPAMSGGVWLSQTNSHDSDKLYGVITDNGSIKTGDVITLTYGYYEDDDVNFENYVTKEMPVEIVGTIKDGSKVLDFGKRYSVHDNFDFRDLYVDYYFEKETVPRLFIPLSQIQGDAHLNFVTYHGNIIVNFEEGLSQERQDELKEQLNIEGMMQGELKQINSNSKDYINTQLIQLLPILICSFTLVIVSSISICALNASRSLRVYGVYFLCGCRWKSCLLINIISNMITMLLGAYLAAVAMAVIKFTGLISKTVLSFGIWQFAGCAALAALNLLAATVIPVILMHRSTPKEILSANE